MMGGNFFRLPGVHHRVSDPCGSRNVLILTPGFPHGIGEGNLIRGQASDGRVRLVIDDVWDWGINPL